MTATVNPPLPAPILASPALASPIVVETILLSVRQGELHYRTRQQPLPDGAHPDALARDLAGFADHSTNAARLLHSTSWRFAGGSVVLTYAGLPDPLPAPAVPLDLRQPLPYAADPLAPTLDHLTVHEVAVHACRHLAYLQRADPVVALTADAAPQLWELIADFSPAVAGLLVQPTR
jgi:hypothetical protein